MAYSSEQEALAALQPRTRTRTTTTTRDPTTRTTTTQDPNLQTQYTDLQNQYTDLQNQFNLLQQNQQPQQLVLPENPFSWAGGPGLGGGGSTGWLSGLVNRSMGNAPGAPIYQQQPPYQGAYPTFQSRMGEGQNWLANIPWGRLGSQRWGGGGFGRNIPQILQQGLGMGFAEGSPFLQWLQSQFGGYQGG